MYPHLPRTLLDVIQFGLPSRQFLRTTETKHIAKMRAMDKKAFLFHLERIGRPIPDALALRSTREREQALYDRYHITQARNVYDMNRLVSTQLAMRTQNMHRCEKPTD